VHSITTTALVAVPYFTLPLGPVAFKAVQTDKLPNLADQWAKDSRKY